MEEEIKNLSLAELKEKSIKYNFDQIISDLKNAFVDDATDEEACRFARIVPSTFYEWKKSSEEFAYEMQLAKDSIFRFSKKVIADKVRSGDVETAKWLVERRQKEIYARRSEVTGAEGNDLDLGLSALKQIADNTSKMLDNEPTTSTGDNQADSQTTVQE